MNEVIQNNKWQAFTAFVQEHKRFYLIYANVLGALVFMYAIVGTPLFEDLVVKEYALNQIVFSMFFSFSFLFYPILGRVYRKEIHPIKWLLCYAIILNGLTVVLDLVGVFPGLNNFLTDYQYGRNYLAGNPSEFYYPPACSLYFLFKYLVNPWRSTLLHRLMTNAFAIGGHYMTIKIAYIKHLGLEGKKLQGALVFLSINAIQTYLLVFIQKFDYFVIFISLIGIYFTLQKRWFLASFTLVFCGFFKLYPFAWLGGMLLVYLKQREWMPFKKVLVSTIVSGAIFLVISLLMEGTRFIDNTLRFGWHYTIWEEVFNLNWSYYLKFTGLPFMNFVPFIILAVVLMLYTMRHAKAVDLSFFINIVLIILLIYPSVNYHYIIWILPLIGLVLVDNKERYRKAIFSYEIIHVNAEMHAFSWFMLFGFENELYLLDGTIPMGLPIILLVKFILLLPMMIGLKLFMISPLSTKGDGETGRSLVGPPGTAPL